MRKLILFVGCPIVLIGVFFLTHAVIDSGPPQPVDVRALADEFAKRRIANYSDLDRTVRDLGPRRAPRLIGNVDKIGRVELGGDVTLTGWVADPQGDATPMEILIFVSGTLAGRARTAGERPDIAQQHGLGFGAEKNVAFAVNFGCPAGYAPIVVALATGNLFIPLISPPCP
jgi:hypothetical protein